MARGGLGVVVRRRWRQLAEAGGGVKAIVGLVVVALVAGIVVAAVGLSGSSGGSKRVASGGGAPTSVGAADTSTRGVTADAITVVFPVINLAAIGVTSVFANQTDESYQEAIKVFVDDINTHGGINGRRINPEVVQYNPQDDADMRAKCVSWTKDQSVFAVIDAGAWHDDHQLCLTQEGRTPLISSWTTVTEWATRGAPYLWWAGVDEGVLLKTLVSWAQANSLLESSTKFAVVASDRESDNKAIDNYLKPALAAAGLSPASIERINYNPKDNTTAAAQAPSVIQRLQSEGVTTVIPLMPLPSLLAYLQAANSQQYYPKMVLSDYEQTVSTSLGLAESLFKKALDGQLGFTYQNLGNSNDQRAFGEFPGAGDCFRTWIAAHPTPFPDADAPAGEVLLELQGPIMTECQNIRLFATAARAAGPNLTHKSFTDAMAAIRNFPAALYPTFTFGPNIYAGAHDDRTVSIHVNDPNHNGCPLLNSGKPQGSCWLIVKDFNGAPPPANP